MSSSSSCIFPASDTCNNLHLLLMLLLLLLANSVRAQQLQQQQQDAVDTKTATCGEGTYFDAGTNTCLGCSSLFLQEGGEDDGSGTGGAIAIAGIFDTDNFPWGEDLFRITVEMIQGGEFDSAVFDAATTKTGNTSSSSKQLLASSLSSMVAEIGGIDYSVTNSACDEATASRAYWKTRTVSTTTSTADKTNSSGTPSLLQLCRQRRRHLQGIVGARCSGASVAVARIAGLEHVPQISPASTSSRLSNADDFPYFNRVVAPDNDRGEVGALVAVLRGFGWDRVTILATDTTFASDLANEFRNLWVGDHYGQYGEDNRDNDHGYVFDDDNIGPREYYWRGSVAASPIVRLQADNTVDAASVRQALLEIPTDDPTINSRVILLAAQNQHAYPILKIAHEMGFQPDTIWVGPSAWTGPRPAPLDTSFLPRYPGYFGVGTKRYEGPLQTKILDHLNDGCRPTHNACLSKLPVFAAEMTDAIVILVAAIASVPGTERHNGTAINARIRTLTLMHGLSGPVAFTETGDRKNPQFSIYNLGDGRKDENGELNWTVVGFTGADVGSSVVALEDVCFAEKGCGLQEAPSDSYPLPWGKLPTWAMVLVVIIILLLLLVAAKYWRSHRSKKRIKAEFEAFRDSVVGMRTAERVYLPAAIPGTTARIRESLKGGKGLSLRFSSSDNINVKQKWCWQETPGCMNLHPLDTVVGDPVDCWIEYDDNAGAILETKWQEQGQVGTACPLPGYVVDFDSMTQKKKATGFERNVMRIPVVSADAPLAFGETSLKSTITEVDLRGSQIGSTLPADIGNEPQVVLIKGDVIQISKQRPDGWAFGSKLYHADEAAAREIVAFVSKKTHSVDDDANVLADTGWFMIDATRVPKAGDLASLEKNVGDTGALKAPSHWNLTVDPSVVEKYALPRGNAERLAVERAFMSSLNHTRTKILSVERIQNLAMWQSYIVKRSTVCNRDKEVSKKATALERFEKHWLWHGTNVEVMDKILQQGFNRSFCGKNATLYGKGVYFARDTSYSSCKTYAVPDSSGNQYIMACRVVVGEYCRGKKDAVTPDIRDVKQHSLYDSTVDTMANPSIYVTYHDAQAYPEYLIGFRQN